VAALRTFIAVPLPLEIRSAIVEFAGQLRPFCGSARWERIDKLHLTMKFLGDTDERLVPEVLDALGAAAAGVAPFDLTVAGFGAFPSMRIPKVLWIGCEDASGALSLLHARIDERLPDLGFQREGRPFHPHVTIARLRDDGVPPHLTSLPKNLNFDPRHTLVAEMILMKSVLRPEGSEYTVIGSSRLS
jgi:2'-5' RNA ligase